MGSGYETRATPPRVLPWGLLAARSAVGLTHPADLRERSSGSVSSGVGDLEFLDPLVARVRHVEMALAIDRHPVGPGELAGAVARAPEPEQELASGREEPGPGRSGC